MKYRVRVKFSEQQPQINENLSINILIYMMLGVYLSWKYVYGEETKHRKYLYSKEIKHSTKIITNKEYQYVSL